MKSITAADMQEIDRKAMDAEPAAGWTLMSGAGTEVFCEIERFAGHAGLQNPRIIFFAGKGNNGGDAFVAAKLCADRGWAVQVWLAGERQALSGDAQTACDEYLEAALPFIELNTCGEHEFPAFRQFNPHIIVDALLGTGVQGDPRGLVAEAVSFINRASRDCFCVSVDIPSGLDADSGLPSEICVRSDLTITLGLPKKGLLAKEAEEAVGSLEAVSIGLPQDLVENAEAADEVELNARNELREIWKPRARETHKGSFGRVLIIGGSPGMSGAPSLAAMAAVQAGAGLVSVLAPSSVASEISAHAPEIMVTGMPCNANGLLDGSFLNEWQDTINSMDCVVIGPGLGQGDEMILVLRQLIRDTKVPMIMDADALNNLERQAHWLERASVPLGITPHPGEMSRLFGQSVEAIQGDREGMAVAAAKFIQSTVVLKGSGTVIAHPEKGLFKNLTGNPGMASGGTGDVLAGIMGSFTAQGYDLFEAARLAVYLHGKAGDIASLKYTQSSTTAKRLIDCLPEALKLLGVR